MLCEVMVSQIHNLTKKKILDLSEVSPNVNSLDVDNNSC